MADDVVIELNLDLHSAVVALTHAPKLDDMALLEALKSPDLLCRRTQFNRQQPTAALASAAVFRPIATEADRLPGPVGFSIANPTSPEIVIAVLAEIAVARNGVWTKNGLPPKQMLFQAGYSITYSV